MGVFGSLLLFFVAFKNFYYVLLLQFKDKIVTVLNFTALLIEHSYARHIYNSTEVRTKGCVICFQWGFDLWVTKETLKCVFIVTESSGRDKVFSSYL